MSIDSNVVYECARSLTRRKAQPNGTGREMKRIWRFDCVLAMRSHVDISLINTFHFLFIDAVWWCVRYLCTLLRRPNSRQKRRETLHLVCLPLFAAGCFFLSRNEWKKMFYLFDSFYFGCAFVLVLLNEKRNDKMNMSTINLVPMNYWFSDITSIEATAKKNTHKRKCEVKWRAIPNWSSLWSIFKIPANCGHCCWRWIRPDDDGDDGNERLLSPESISQSSWLVRKTDRSKQTTMAMNQANVACKSALPNGNINVKCASIWLDLVIR